MLDGVVSIYAGPPEAGGKNVVTVIQVPLDKNMSGGQVMNDFMQNNATFFMIITVTNVQKRGGVEL